MVEREPGHSSDMTPEQLKLRTRQFALRAIRAVDSLPNRRSAETMGRQLLRSATSVGANYRAACRARSQAEFIAKLGIVEEEADETLYWMELLIDAGLLSREKLSPLMQEANEILAIVVASINTARGRTRRPDPRKSGNLQSAISSSLSLRAEGRNPQ